jgi:hypothetical protein
MEIFGIAIFGVTLFGVVVGIIISLLIGALVVYFAAKLSGVKDATFGKAITICLASIVVEILIALVFSVLPVLGTIAGFLIGLFLTLLIIKSVYNTGWGRALVVWIMQWVVLVIAGLIIAVLAGILAL